MREQEDLGAAVAETPAPAAERPAPEPASKRRNTTEEKSLSRKTARLSPLKQAVIWAEILGTPKGLS
jgi:hypothetical protein